MIDLNDLEAKAKAAAVARPGDWEQSSRERNVICGEMFVAQDCHPDCSRFIAAAKPSTILALIERSRELEGALGLMLSDAMDHLENASKGQPHD